MRTTVTLDDELLAEARRVAARRCISLSLLLEEGLRATLAAGCPTPRTVPPLPTGSSGLPYDLDWTSNEAVRDYIDEMDGVHANAFI